MCLCDSVDCGEVTHCLVSFIAFAESVWTSLQMLCAVSPCLMSQQGMHIHVVCVCACVRVCVCVRVRVCV